MSVAYTRSKESRSMGKTDTQIENKTESKYFLPPPPPPVEQMKIFEKFEN